jgi:carboxylesterase type B
MCQATPPSYPLQSRRTARWALLEIPSELVTITQRVSQVVVSLNFRMGVLGFLPTRNLEGSNVSGTGGLNGMHDVIVALQ